jgi:hypothetical protein
MIAHNPLLHSLHLADLAGAQEKRNENQRDQRIRGRPGQGPALLYGGPGLCRKKADFSHGPFRWLTVV